VTLFQHIDDAGRRPLNQWIPVVWCLVAAGFVALLASSLPGFRRLTPVQLALQSTSYVTIVFAVSAAAAWAGFIAVRPRWNVAASSVVLRFAAAAVWFVPVMIFIARSYLWSIAAAVVFASALAKLLRDFERSAIGRHDAEQQPGLAAILPAAVVIQTGMVAAVAGYMAAAACLLALSCSVVAWWAAATDPPKTQPDMFRPSIQGVVASVLLAIQLTGCGLMPYVSRPASRTTAEDKTKEDGGGRADLYSGIILLPEVQRHVAIVPPLPAVQRNLLRAGTSSPLSFSFSGEYWFFYHPRQRPPKNSLVVYGAPTAFKFTSLPGVPLLMQARQAFTTPIDVQCCSRIEIVISNTDPLPGTVSLELILANTALTGENALSLGEAEVIPAKKMLSFELPRQSVIRYFNEMMIVFHLRAPRMNRSANIAVDRFYLVPRSL
jgi:hypothetical protein